MNTQIKSKGDSMSDKVLAFTGTLVSYDDFFANVQLHKELDNYVQGAYWDGVRGCAIGCTLNDAICKPEIEEALRKLDVEIEPSNHALFMPLFGIPRIIARLQDRIFEGLTENDAKEFPLQFAQALKAGVDLSGVWDKFAHWLLFDSEKGVIRFAKTERTRNAITGVAALYQRRIDGDNPEVEEWREARSAAAYAAYAAYAAAAAADAADAADAAAKHEHYRAIRDKLLALLAECGERIAA